MATARPAQRRADPPKHWHDPRYRHAKGAPKGPRRRALGRGRGKLCRHPNTGRYVFDGRPNRAIRRPARHDCRGQPRTRAPAQSGGVQRHEIRHIHPTFAAHIADFRQRRLARFAPTHPPMARATKNRLGPACCGAIADRKLPARGAGVSVFLWLCGAQCATNAGPDFDQTHGRGRARAAGLCGHRLCHIDLGAKAGGKPRRAA